MTLCNKSLWRKTLQFAIDVFKIKTYIKRAYDIKIEKSYAYIEKMLQELNENSNINKTQYYLLLATMYENKDDTDNASKYYKLYEDYLKNISSKKRF